MNTNYETIDQYIAMQPKNVVLILKKIRETIREVAPNAEETISYGIPTFKYHGNLVHFSAYKNHIGFYPGAIGIKAFKDQIAIYNSSKGTVQFAIDKPIPFELIKNITEFRITENKEKYNLLKMLTVKTTINAPLEKVWEFWTNPDHIVHWNFASDDWHCPKATNDLQIGKKFCYTMASKDGKNTFDFEGEYTEIENQKTIKYKLADERKIIVLFKQNNGFVTVTESFDPEKENTLELQQNGWQAIIDNFKKYIETI